MQAHSSHRQTEQPLTRAGNSSTMENPFSVSVNFVQHCTDQVVTNDNCSGGNKKAHYVHERNESLVYNESSCRLFTCLPFGILPKTSTYTYIICENNGSKSKIENNNEMYSMFTMISVLTTLINNERE